jgi:cytochrome c-type biogenesis protein CcmH
MRLFVYARNPAMPMPLAVQNLALPDFPITVTLDDSMAMLENMSLSSSPNVIVGARLSRSGQATAQSGDIQAVSEPFVLSEQDGPVLLTIRDIVP